MDKLYHTLRASLSGTFLQTLPDLITPLKGALFISAQLSSDAVSALQKGLSTNKKCDCGSNLASKHPRKHETHLPRVKKKRKKKLRLDSKDFDFISAGVSSMVIYKTKRLI